MECIRKQMKSMNSTFTPSFRECDDGIAAVNVMLDWHSGYNSSKIRSASPSSSSSFASSSVAAATTTKSSKILPFPAADDECDDGGDATSFDVICIDNEMNNMHGLEATRCIRSMGYKGFIIAITGSTTQDDIDAFASAGTNYFLEKPLTLKRLRDILISVLASKH